MIGWLCLMLGIAGQTMAAPENPPVTVSLKEAYQAALKRSETIGSQTEAINQAEATYRQALGAVYPTITGQATYTRIDTSGLGGLGGAFYPANQWFAKIGLDQPLFRGFREFAALKYTSYLSDSAREAKRQAQVQLLEDVATNYFTVLALEQDIRNYEAENKLYDDRVSDLRHWVRIGRSRETEVLTVQSSQAALRSTLEQSRGQLEASRVAFAFLTGLPRDTALSDVDMPRDVGGIDQYLDRLTTRPDVRAATINLQAAQQNIRVSEGQHYPSLDLLGNYYFVRPGVQSSIHWDVGLQLSVPIFDGGVINSQVHQAQSKAIQSELAVSLAKRQADQEIRTVHANLDADMRQIAQLTDGEALAERNFKEQRREYRLGLVTNLDVLTAMTSYEDARRALDHARFQAKMDFTKLEAASQRSPLLPAGGLSDHSSTFLPSRTSWVSSASANK